MGGKEKVRREEGEREREKERKANIANHNCFRIFLVEHLFTEYLKYEDI